MSHFLIDKNISSKFDIIRGDALTVGISQSEIFCHQVTLIDEHEEKIACIQRNDHQPILMNCDNPDLISELQEQITDLRYLLCLI